MSFDGAILGACNPLLDISATVPQAFLDKYGFKLNNAILAEEKDKGVYADVVQNFPHEYVAGGATQNSIRVAQWMLQRPYSTAYFGAVGKDEYAKELNKAADACQMKAHYQVSDVHPTGTCACLIHDKERSLVANLGAASHFTIDHLMTPESQAIINKARIIYSSGFFLTSSPQSALYLAEHASANNKVFCENLSALFIVQFFDKAMMDVMPHVDIMFGNESEAEAFAQKHGLADTSPTSAAKFIANMPKKNGARPRVAIITQGSKATIIATGDSVTEHPVPKIPKENIVDTNGAGDAFVGGFLAALAAGKSMEVCVDAGHYAAGFVLTKTGTQLTGKPAFEL